MGVNISGTFTKETKPLNGLEAIANDLVDDAKQHHQYVVVGIISPKFYKANAEDGTRTPNVMFDHIEVVFDGAEETARRLLKDRHADRTRVKSLQEMKEIRERELAASGQDELPFDGDDGPGSVKRPDAWLGEPDPDAWKPSDRPAFKAPESADDSDIPEGD